jgi:hypothetical protein
MQHNYNIIMLELSDNIRKKDFINQCSSYKKINREFIGTLPVTLLKGRYR